MDYSKRNTGNINCRVVHICPTYFAIRWGGGGGGVCFWVHVCGVIFGAAAREGLGGGR